MEKNLNPKSILHEGRTSSLIFLYPTIISICIIFYLIDNFSLSNLAIIFPIIVLGFVLPSLHFYRKRFILTKNSIYLFVRGKQIFKWSLMSDFAGIDIRYDKIGKIFGYGTLILVNREGKMYEYFFLENPNEMKHRIILSYEKMMKDLDSNFICSYTLECKNKDT